MIGFMYEPAVDGGYVMPNKIVSIAVKTLIWPCKLADTAVL